MAVNRGKQFEAQVQAGFTALPDTYCLRLIDPQAGYAGVYNICDFVVYHKPLVMFLECKSVHTNTLSIYSNDPKKKYGKITNGQWEGLVDASRYDGVVAGYIVWFVDRDITLFVTAQELKRLRDGGEKSLHCDKHRDHCIEVSGKKKRVLFNYDMGSLLQKLGVDINL